MSWPEPPDEAERVRVLHSLDVLDVPKQEEFERITSLCGAALDVPVCLVSLVDAQRQWFLSNRGLGDVRETGRELAFCGHAIMPRSDGGLHSDEPVDVFVVRDAEADDRFSTNSLVTGWPHIRFYAGTALRVAGSDGVKRAIGTLCVIDTAVEHGGTGARCADAFGAREKQILMDFGALVVGAIEGRTAAKRTLAMAKNDYISCTAHDIRTPVACFQLSLELLAASPLSDEQREYVTDAQLCVEVITETVERAIETARQQRGAAPSPARRERVDVRGSKRVRISQLQRLLSRPVSTRFG
jgi:GAF domain-containing protein